MIRGKLLHFVNMLDLIKAFATTIKKRSARFLNHFNNFKRAANLLLRAKILDTINKCNKAKMQQNRKSQNNNIDLIVCQFLILFLRR